MTTRPQLTDRIMEMLGTDANEHDAALVFETLLDDGKITRDANGYTLAPDADVIAAWGADDENS